MKKTYINPTIEVVKLQMHQQMLTGSNPEVTYDSSEESTIAPGSVEGRYYDFDDEEEY